MTLNLVSHPLPVSWDGLPVKWGRWESSDHIRICPPPKSRCECGSTRSPFTAVGLRAPASGAEAFARRHALRDIHAFRCPDCGQVESRRASTTRQSPCPRRLTTAPTGRRRRPSGGLGGLLDMLR